MRKMQREPTGQSDKGLMKTHAYGSLYTINHAFQEIAENLTRLEDQAVVTPDFAEDRRVAIEEMRASINHGILGPMLSSEQDDWAYFGRLGRNQKHNTEERG